MRFHCLGVGSIGSLLATNLARLPDTQVRLLLRRKDLAHHHLTQPGDSPAAATTSTPTGYLTVERNGIARRSPPLELELLRSPNDDLDHSSSSAHSSRSPRIDPRQWIRQDPIHTLIVTTKAPHTLPALRPLLPRLTSSSVIVLCHNGMGVLEALLDKYWPEDRSDSLPHPHASGAPARPSFVCATTTHGAWRKGPTHFVHAGLGDLKFGVLPNRAALAAIAAHASTHATDPDTWDPADHPLLNPRSLVPPSLDDHLPPASSSSSTASLRATLAALLACRDLHPTWLPLPALQLAQLQKLAVNAGVNTLTALMGVNNGALVGSQKATRLLEAVARECSEVFAAQLAVEEGTWAPPPPVGQPQQNRGEDDDDEADRPSFSSTSSPPPLPPSHPLSAPSLLEYTQRVLFKTAPNLSSTLSDLLALHSGQPSAAAFGAGSPSSSSSSSSFSLSHNAPSLPSRTEIEYMNGYLVALGRKYGVRTDTVRTLGELVLLKEEMGRVGAVDRVWAAKGGHRAAGGRRRQRGEEEEEGGEGVHEASSSRRRPRPRTSASPPNASIFRARSPSSPYERGAQQLALTRERREERAQRRARDRIEADGGVGG